MKVTPLLLTYGVFSRYVRDTEEQCPSGFFKLSSMKDCHRHLNCDDMEQIKLKKMINSGMAKEIHLAKWNGNTLVYSIPNRSNPERLTDFKHNQEMLEQLQSKHVVQLIGKCGDAILTEYHPNGTLGDLIESEYYEQFGLLDRIKLAIRYVEIVSYLHDSPAGTRVMCDSNRVKGTVKQYLVTAENDLVINDLDDLKLVENGKMEGRLCSHADYLYNRRDILKEKFLAPEQYRYNATVLDNLDEYSEDDLPSLNEKIDIYKIPAITGYILGTVAGHTSVMEKMQPIHAMCLNRNPKLRPSARVIHNAYAKVLSKL